MTSQINSLKRYILGFIPGYYITHFTFSTDNPEGNPRTDETETSNCQLLFENGQTNTHACN